MNQFEETIKAYLDERAQSDPQFAERYANPKKSIEDCCKYIIGWVKAQKREGYADAEIYGQAVHYYDEDNIKITEVKGAKVVVNHAIQLSETEERQAKEAARRRFEDEELKKLQEARNKAQQKRKSEPAAAMADLFG